MMFMIILLGLKSDGWPKIDQTIETYKRAVKETDEILAIWWYLQVLVL